MLTMILAKLKGYKAEASVLETIPNPQYCTRLFDLKYLEEALWAKSIVALAFKEVLVTWPGDLMASNSDDFEGMTTPPSSQSPVSNFQKLVCVLFLSLLSFYFFLLTRPFFFLFFSVHFSLFCSLLDYLWDLGVFMWFFLSNNCARLFLFYFLSFLNILIIPNLPSIIKWLNWRKKNAWPRFCALPQPCFEHRGLEWIRNSYLSKKP